MTSPIPETMRAACYGRYGEPEVLEVREVAVPEPGRNELLVRVHAAGMNPKDALVRSGELRLLSGRNFPKGTGFDFAGVVAATGEGVDGPAPGTVVWGFLDGTAGGAAAEYLVTPRRWTARAPDGLSWTEAAALPLVACSALQALRDVGRLEAGERVLIRGASGGVGSAAIQVARAMGGRVTAIASGPNLDHCRELGAEAAVDYRTTDPTTLDERFDVFVDCVGGSSLRGYGRLLGRGGRWVAVAPDPRVYAIAPFSRLLSPLLRLPRLGFLTVRPVTDDLDEIRRLVEAGELTMPVTRTYPLDEVRAAHADVAERHGRGKAVVVVSDEAAGS